MEVPARDLQGVHSAMRAEEIVDLSSYPIDDLGLPASRRLVEASRAEFEITGFCVLPDFIRSAALSVLVDEANALADTTYYCRQSHTPYLKAGDDDLPATHPRRREEQTYVGSIAYDFVPEDAALRVLYGWDPLRDFIAAVLDKPALHRSADPFGACSINVFCDGGRHGWHFDESEFTVTLMLQAPEAGGAFEYVPQIRGLPEEERIVGDVLDGARDGVVQLPFTPGALLIFGGHRTLHRVTPVSGDRLRLVPVLCYGTSPGQQNSDTVRKLFWGRTGAEAVA